MMAAEFLAIPPDGKRYELIDGEFIVHTTPPVRHQCVLANIVSPLSTYCRGRDAKTFPGPLDVHLSDDSVVEPDGTRRRDEVDKRGLYERLAIDEYWIVDPDNDSVTIYRRTGSSFALTETGGTITSPLLPGFALDINVIFDV